MDPINYSSAFDNLPSPQDALMAGIKNGVGLQQLQIERQQAEAKRAQEAQMRTDLANLSGNMTPEAIASMSVKYPHLSEQFKRSYDMLAPEVQKARLQAAAPIYAAIRSGEHGLASKMLRDNAAALENSGKTAEANQTRAMADLVDQHPETASFTIGTMLSAAMGPDKFTEAFKGIGVERRAEELQGDLVRKGAAEATGAEADAQTKAVTAKYADSQALADLEKKRWDVRKIVADIDFQKESNRIAAMNAAANREGNALKKQELQLRVEEARRDRDDKLRAKVADVESAAGNIDNMLNTIERIKKNPSLDSVVGSMEGRSLYPNATLGTLNPLGDGDERSDAIALIETLGSQAFLSQIPNIKGMGALSNAEGEKLQAAFQNLSRAQSEKQFRATLDEATRLLNKGRATISKRYGVPLGAPDTPAASAADKPPIDSFFR
jgi:hypothetical protein